jgi:ubiquinone/menaquinone biosynthesis C-methylase UbiE
MKSEWLWNKLATGWDKPDVSLGENDRKILEITKQYINADSIVLDYGCATGSILLELTGRVKETHGVDISLKMIDIAKRKAGERQVNNAVFTQGTIFNERFKKESIDVILALNVLHLLEDLPQVIARVHYVLKPGGVFISVSPCLGENKLLSFGIRAPIFLASKTGLLPHVNFFTAANLKDMLNNGNFRVIDSADLSGNSLTETYIAARKNQ